MQEFSLINLSALDADLFSAIMENMINNTIPSMFPYGICCPCNGLETLQEDFLWEMALQPNSSHCYETFPDKLCVCPEGTLSPFPFPLVSAPFTHFRWTHGHPQAWPFGDMLMPFTALEIWVPSLYLGH